LCQNFLTVPSGHFFERTQDFSGSSVHRKKDRVGYL
jgi:hypothetical protein